MAFEPFGLVGGLSVGIPSTLVIDENGNFVANVATTGNVSANVISANTFKFANGANLTTQAAGSNTQVQFNSNDEFAADPSFTFDSTQALLTVSNLYVGSTANLGDVANVTILGGIDGYFLQTDGAGALTWAPAGNGGGGNGSPGGSNTEIQYNKAGDFGGDAGFTYNDITNTLRVANIIATSISATTFTGTLVGNATLAGSVTTNSQPNITSVGTLTTLAVTGNITSGNANLGNTVTANYFVGNLNGPATTAGTVTTNAQPNITSVGTLTALSVTGNISSGNVSATTFTGNLTGNATTAGTVTTNAQPNITSVGTLSNLAVTGNVSAANFVGNLSGNATTAGTVTTNAQPNITSIGTLTSLAVTGNITSGNVSATTFTGNLSGNATRAGTVTTNAQPNITSVGTLVSLAVTGNVTSGNANLGNAVVANYFIGDGGYLSNLQISNASVSNANYAAFAGNVTLAGQSNITSLGTLTSLTVSGNITGANLITANYFRGNAIGWANTVTNNAQPNITSVGTLLNLSVTGNINAGNVAGGNLVSANYLTGILTTNPQPNITSVGTLTGLNVNGNITAANITANTGVFTGNGSGLTRLTGANVTGTVANANYSVWAGHASTANIVTDNAQPNITSVGPLVSLEVVGNIYVDTNSFLGNIATANYFVGNANGLSNISGANITGTVANANYAAYAGNVDVANTVRNNVQSNITSVGTLTSLSVSGISNFAGNVTVANTGNFRARGNVNFASSPNVFIGNIGNLHITGGFPNYVLTTDGSGNLRWTMGGGGNGGGGTPGLPVGAVQFNDNGSFGGSSTFRYDTESDLLSMTNAVVSTNLTANSITIGANEYVWSTAFVHFATTASTTSGQVICSIPITSLSGVEFHIIATDPAGPSRQSIKISSTYYNGSVQYTEYAGLYINGGVGNFDVEYFPGDEVTPESIQLSVSPNTADTVSYKILVTLFAD